MNNHCQPAGSIMPAPPPAPACGEHLRVTPNLPDLPNELIIQIIESLAASESRRACAAVVRLASCSRALRSLAAPFAFRHLSLSHLAKRDVLEVMIKLLMTDRNGRLLDAVPILEHVSILDAGLLAKPASVRIILHRCPNLEAFHFRSMTVDRTSAMGSLLAALPPSCKELGLNLDRAGMINADTAIVPVLDKGQWKIVLTRTRHVAGGDTFLAALGDCDAVVEVEVVEINVDSLLGNELTALRRKMKRFVNYRASALIFDLSGGTPPCFPNVTIVEIFEPLDERDWAILYSHFPKLERLRFSLADTSTLISAPCVDQPKLSVTLDQSVSEPLGIAKFVSNAAEVPNILSARFKEVRIARRTVHERIWDKVPGMIKAWDASRTLIWRAP